MSKDEPEFQTPRQFSAQNKELDLNGLNIPQFERNITLYAIIVSHSSVWMDFSQDFCESTYIFIT